MNVIRKCIATFAGVVIILITILMVNFNDLSWTENKASYGLIFSQICVIFSMIFSIRHVNKINKKRKDSQMNKLEQELKNKK